MDKEIISLHQLVRALTFHQQQFLKLLIGICLKLFDQSNDSRTRRVAKYLIECDFIRNGIGIEGGGGRDQRRCFSIAILKRDSSPNN